MGPRPPEADWTWVVGRLLVAESTVRFKGPKSPSSLVVMAVVEVVNGCRVGRGGEDTGLGKLCPTGITGVPRGGGGKVMSGVEWVEGTGEEEKDPTSNGCWVVSVVGSSCDVVVAEGLVRSGGIVSEAWEREEERNQFS